MKSRHAGKNTDPPFNLFQGLPVCAEHESVLEILKDQSIRIERIVSHGQASSPGFWYDQNEHEWIALLSGQAVLHLEGNTEPVTLRPGDTLLLPAHTKHRVEWTDPMQSTVWLAIFWKP